MRILVFTQKVDKNDPVLGFVVSWLREFSLKFQSVEVICLEKGDFDLPNNVTVYSLGKENKISRVGYLIAFYKYLNLISGSYDRVFVHMNQEYVLLAGLYWRIKRIPVYLWRNHPKGTLITRIAVWLSTKVFCTSKSSFTARFKKTVIMPAGIDTASFKPVEGAVRKKYSVCVVGRISPIKHVELALEAMETLLSRGVQTSMSIIGPSLQKDLKYVDSLKKYVIDHNMSTVVSFLGAVTPHELPKVYSGHEICLNLTQSGSFDKTVIEAASCGAVPLVANSSFLGLLPQICITENNPESIATSIEKILDPTEQIKIQKELELFVQSQSLNALTSKLLTEINHSV